MSDSQQVTSRGFGLGTVLFIVFLILKLTNTIDCCLKKWTFNRKLHKANNAMSDLERAFKTFNK